MDYRISDELRTRVLNYIAACPTGAQPLNDGLRIVQELSRLTPADAAPSDEVADLEAARKAMQEKKGKQ